MIEEITLGQIAAALGIITVIGGFIIGIFRWYKKTFDDKFAEIHKEIDEIKADTQKQKEEIHDSKEERLVLINGLLACLKGLHDDLKCNGPVTQGIEDIEKYLVKKSHE